MNSIKNRQCIIFAGGEISDYSFIPQGYFQNKLVICADSGYNHALRLGVPVDIVCGDFDSAGTTSFNAGEIIRHPAEKDDTDTLLAIRLAIEKG